jgi:hypothetical protein
MADPFSSRLPPDPPIIQQPSGLNQSGRQQPQPVASGTTNQVLLSDGSGRFFNGLDRSTNPTPGQSGVVAASQNHDIARQSSGRQAYPQGPIHGSVPSNLLGGNDHQNLPAGNQWVPLTHQAHQLPYQPVTQPSHILDPNLQPQPPQNRPPYPSNTLHYNCSGCHIAIPHIKVVELLPSSTLGRHTDSQARHLLAAHYRHYEDLHYTIAYGSVEGWDVWSVVNALGGRIVLPAPSSNSLYIPGTPPPFNPANQQGGRMVEQVPQGTYGRSHTPTFQPSFDDNIHRGQRVEQTGVRNEGASRSTFPLRQHHSQPRPETRHQSHQRPAQAARAISHGYSPGTPLSAISALHPDVSPIYPSFDRSNPEYDMGAEMYADPEEHPSCSMCLGNYPFRDMMIPDIRRQPEQLYLTYLCPSCTQGKLRFCSVCGENFLLPRDYLLARMTEEEREGAENGGKCRDCLYALSNDLEGGNSSIGLGAGELCPCGFEKNRNCPTCNKGGEDPGEGWPRKQEPCTREASTISTEREDTPTLSAGPSRKNRKRKHGKQYEDDHGLKRKPEKGKCKEVTIKQEVNDENKDDNESEKENIDPGEVLPSIEPQNE